VNRRTVLSLVLSLSAFTAFAVDAKANGPRAPRLNPNRVRLSQRDHARLDRTARRFESEIRQQFTPVVDLHIAEASSSAGVRWRKIQNPRFGTKGPTIFEVEGIDKAGGELEMVLSGGASGHVMQQQYGGRSFSVVEGYGQNDTVYLTHRRPGQTRTERVVQTRSRGLVTQEGFNVKLEKGTHDFFYFRGGPNEASGGEGSEPELRHVQIVVK
jgi:hypothetical protein